MQDPSTPNPSESGKPGSDSEQPPKKPLKLRPLGQPKPGEDKADQKDAPDADNKPEKPAIKAIPTEPVPPAESEMDDRRKNLRLRRIVVKDIEINPHINPDAEPVPEAQPYEEPEEAPPPPDLKAVMEAPPEEDQAMPPISQEEPTAVEEPPPPEKPSPPNEPEAKKISPVRRIIAGLAFLGVFCLLALLGIAYFNPFGKDLAPIQPGRIPIAAEKADSSGPDSPEESTNNVASLPVETNQPDLQAYIGRLKTHRLIPSDSPKGIFIDSVFVPEGAVLDPRIQLTLSAVSSSANGSVILLTPPDAPAISIPLDPGK